MSETGQARNKIAVLGFTEHRRLAPWNNVDWELWGLNDLYLDFPPNIPLIHERLRWFQLHEWSEQGPHFEPNVVDFSEGPPHPRDPGHVNWLRDTASKIPLYMLRKRDEVPDAIQYPMDDIFEFFTYGNGKPVRYFTNSITYMIALAIMELTTPTKRNGTRLALAKDGAELGVYGVDMMMGGGEGSEYGYQRPSCEWILGWAMSCGIKVIVPDESDLMKSAFQYGEHVDNPFRKKLKQHRDELARRSNILNNQVQQAQHGVSELRGALNTIDWINRSHMPGDGTESAGRVPLPHADKGLARIGVNPFEDESK